MARKDDKRKKYEGYKHAIDTAGEREVRLKRAEKNAQGESTTNEMFAVQDQAFKDACETAGVKPTKRQASKFRNAYGAAARVVGSNKRKDPLKA